MSKKGEVVFNKGRNVWAVKLRWKGQRYFHPLLDITTRNHYGARTFEDRKSGKQKENGRGQKIAHG